MKRFYYTLMIGFGFLVGTTGCTQVVTAPIKVASSVVSGTIDIAGSAVGAVTGSDDED